MQSGHGTLIHSGATLVLNNTVSGTTAAAGLPSITSGSLVNNGSVAFGGSAKFTNGLTLAAPYSYASPVAITRNCSIKPAWVTGAYSSGAWYVEGWPQLNKRGSAGYVLKAPIGATISTVSMSIKPVNSHTGLPSVMPSIGLYYQDTTRTNGIQVIQTAVDPTTVLATYNAVHTVTCYLYPTPVLQPNFIYWVFCSAEDQTNALDGMGVIGVQWGGSVTTLDYCRFTY